jgi:hypothetical protein
MKTFHTYIDWTLEDVPRPFYVGKGNDGRARNPERNQKHRYVRKMFGFRREIVFSSIDEKACFSEEIKLIRELHTYIHDEAADMEIACNFTYGGDGASGWIPTPTQRENMSKAQKLLHERRPDLANTRSKLMTRLMSDPAHVKKVSDGVKRAMSAMPEEKKKEMHRKTASSNIGRISPQRGRNCWRTRLNDETVRTIRQKFIVLQESNGMTATCRLLMEEFSDYGLGYNAVYKIVTRATWKHVE